MKTKILIPLIALFLLAGCKTFDVSMLSPKNEPITPKLLTLEKRIGDMANTNITPNYNDVNIFTKEVENNLIDPYGDKYGYIALKTNVIDYKIGTALYYTSLMFMSIPNIFGMPFMHLRYIVEVEIRILDRNNKLIGKYSAIGKSSVKVAYYYGYSMKNAFLKAYPDALLDALNKIRPEIQSDARRVNEKLFEAGKL